MHNGIQVTGGPLPHAGLPLACNSQELAVSHSAGNGYFYPSGFSYRPASMAGFAGFSDDLSPAPAVRARGDGHDLLLTALLHPTDLTGTPAGGAVPHKSGLTTGAMAGRALVIMRDFNRVFYPVECISQRDLDIIPEIRPCPALRSSGSSRSPGEDIKDITQTKVAEEIIITRRLIPRKVTGSKRCIPHLIILGLLFGVAQNLVGFVDLLELRFCLFAAFIEIRVIFPCKLANDFFISSSDASRETPRVS